MSGTSKEESLQDSVWTRPAREGAGFGTAELAVAAVRLLDDEGSSALTMRRMAREMGVATTSSLYWRVRNKGELLELAVDAVVGESFDGRTGGSSAESLCGALYDSLVRHPWAAGLLASQSGLGPNYLRLTSAIALSLKALGIPPERAAAALAAVFYYTIGAAVSSSAWVGQVRVDASGGASSIVARLDPAAAAYLTDAFSVADGQFEAGLGLVLAGIRGEAGFRA